MVVDIVSITIQQKGGIGNYHGTFAGWMGLQNVSILLGMIWLDRNNPIIGFLVRKEKKAVASYDISLSFLLFIGLQLIRRVIIVLLFFIHLKLGRESGFILYSLWSLLYSGGMVTRSKQVYRICFPSLDILFLWKPSTQFIVSYLKKGDIHRNLREEESILKVQPISC